MEMIMRLVSMVMQFVSDWTLWLVPEPVWNWFTRKSRWAESRWAIMVMRAKWVVLPRVRSSQLTAACQWMGGYEHDHLIEDLEMAFRHEQEDRLYGWAHERVVEYQRLSAEYLAA